MSRIIFIASICGLLVLAGLYYVNVVQAVIPAYGSIESHLIRLRSLSYRYLAGATLAAALAVAAGRQALKGHRSERRRESKTSRQRGLS